MGCASPSPSSFRAGREETQPRTTTSLLSPLSFPPFSLHYLLPSMSDEIAYLKNLISQVRWGCGCLFEWDPGLTASPLFALDGQLNDKVEGLEKSAKGSLSNAVSSTKAAVAAVVPSPADQLRMILIGPPGAGASLFPRYSERAR